MDPWIGRPVKRPKFSSPELSPATQGQSESRGTKRPYSNLTGMPRKHGWDDVPSYRFFIFRSNLLFSGVSFRRGQSVAGISADWPAAPRTSALYQGGSPLFRSTNQQKLASPSSSGSRVSLFLISGSLCVLSNLLPGPCRFSF